MSDEASRIFLLDVSTDEAVEAELLCEVQECHINDWMGLWQPAMAKIRAELSARGIAKGKLPQSGHWNWARKIDEVDGILDFRSFCITVDKVTQGLMRTDISQISQVARIESQKGRPLVYVDYLEAAPWNCSYHGSPVLYRGIGTALITAAIELSLEEGYKGRIGLHSLPQSNDFYAKLGMTDLGPDAKCQKLRYFEMTSEQAKDCLGEE